MLLCTFPMPQQRRSPSGKLFHGTPASSSSATALPARNTSASAPWPATSSRWLFATLPLASSSATASRPAAFASCPYQQLRHGAPASNKPHPAEKSTPVWLAIWRTWAGFANSQLLSAAFLSLYLYICAYPRYCNLRAAAQTDANLSAHLHRLPTPPPYLRQMRLLPGRGAGVGCKMRLSLCQGEGVGWQMMLLVARVALPANHRAHESLF